MQTKKNKDTVRPIGLQHFHFIMLSFISAPFIVIDDVPWILAIIFPAIVLVGMYQAFYMGTGEMLNQIAKDITEATNNNKEN